MLKFHSANAPFLLLDMLQQWLLVQVSALTISSVLEESSSET